MWEVVVVCLHGLEITCDPQAQPEGEWVCTLSALLGKGEAAPKTAAQPRSSQIPPKAFYFKRPMGTAAPSPALLSLEGGSQRPPGPGAPGALGAPQEARGNARYTSDPEDTAQKKRVKHLSNSSPITC